MKKKPKPSGILNQTIASLPRKIKGKRLRALVATQVIKLNADPLSAEK